MSFPTQTSSLGVFKSLIDPWYESLKNPQEAQMQTLSNMLTEYRKTQYGTSHNASDIHGISDFRANFSVIDYNGLNPYLTEVKEGNYSAILPEPLLCWVMTRGSTGPAKVLPATKTHIQQILTCGSRALINYIVKNKNYNLLEGRVLNLNFPTNVHTMIIDGKPVAYGYSSGTYAKLIPALGGISLLPSQEDIDSLGPGITKQDWEKRFELAYQKGLTENVTATMGVTPVILSFARYVQKKHGKKPKDFWNLQALFCTSVRKIQIRYAPLLRKYFGQVPVIEVYSATEGVFAQQLDELPYVTPNYDTYLFEVETGNGTKMLHELKRGEWGRLIVSSCMFPRYNIGDLIEAAGKNYFRIVGRNNVLTLLEHRFFRLFFGFLI